MEDYSLDTDKSRRLQDDASDNRNAIVIYRPPAAVLSAWRARGYPSLALEWALEARERKLRLNGRPGAAREPEPISRSIRQYQPEPCSIPREAGPDSYAHAHAVLDGWTVNAPEARLPDPKSPAEIIKRIIAKHFRTTVAELIGPSRIKLFSLARQIAVYFHRELTKESTTKIGRRYRRDHSTIVVSIQRIKGRIAIDAKFAARIDRLGTRLEFAIFLSTKPTGLSRPASKKQGGSRQ